MTVDRDRQTPDVDAASPPPDPAPRREPPPELAGITKEEFRALYEATWLYARRLTKSEDLANELTQGAFELLYSTRRWDPSGDVPISKHMLGIVKSTLHHRRADKRPLREREGSADFVRAVGDTAQSAEDVSLARAEAEARRARAERTLDRLRARLAGNRLALDRLDLIAKGIDKPAEQSRHLKVRVEEIYRAREATEHHLQKIRAEEREGEE